MIHKILKISMTKVWHKHNLIVSLVGSDHPEQYSYEITYEYLSGWEILLEKIISTKHQHYFPYRICSNFLEQLYFLRSYFFTFLRSHYVDKTVTFSEQLLFLRSSFFRTVVSLRQFFFFFRIATFSEQNFYQAASSRE